MKAKDILTLLFITFAISVTANAKPLFVDDFEAGLSDGWIIGHLDGQSEWEVVKLDGNSVLKVDSTGGGWTGATVDGIASMGDYNELWAVCRFMAQPAGKPGLAQWQLVSFHLRGRPGDRDR